MIIPNHKDVLVIYLKIDFQLVDYKHLKLLHFVANVVIICCLFHRGIR